MECIHCGEWFDPNHPRHKAKGRVNECGDCAKDIRKSIGVFRCDGKTDYGIEIIEEPTATQVKLVANAGKHGPSHCHGSLGLNSNGSSTKKQNIDKVQESLEKSSKEERKRQQYER